MTKTLYLHIGWGRCGSSSIQHFAEANRAALLERGIWYPSAEEMGFEQTRGGNGQFLRKTSKRNDVRRAAVFDQIASSVARAPAAATLLSSEFLCALPEEFYQALKQACDRAAVAVVCIAYIREQREWLLSRYAQAVKSKQWTLSLQDYLRERHQSPNLDYAQRFKAFAGAFGKERAVARLFQRNDMIGGDVRIDLFDILKVDVRKLIRDEPNANASASVQEIEVMRAVNLAQPERPFNHRDFLRKSQSHFTQKQWQPSHELYRLVDPLLMRQIKSYYDASNDELRREYFPDRPAPLFHSRIPDIYEVLPAAERINERSIELLLNYFAPARSQVQPPAKAKRKRPNPPAAEAGAPLPKAKSWRSLFGR